MQKTGAQDRIARKILYLCNRYPFRRMKKTQAIHVRFWAYTMLLTTLCALFSAQNAVAGKQPEVFSIWKKLSNEQLVRIGHQFANDPEHPDSALLALTIVTNRYDKGMNREERILVQRAQRMKGFVYLFRYYDYAKAYDCFIHAQDIAEEVNYISPATALYLGHLFSTIGDQTRDRAVQQKALDYMRNAFREGLAVKDYNTINVAFGNAITLAWTLGEYDALKEEWKVFKRLKNEDAPEFTRFNFYYYQMLMLLKEKRYEASLPLFDKQAALMKDDWSHSRYTMTAFYNKARVLALLGRYTDAIDQLLRCEHISQRYGTKDISVEIYRQLAEYQQHLGNKELSAHYQSRYFALKDSILNLQQYANIKELSFAGSLRKVNEQMEQGQRERQILATTLIVLAIIAIVISLSLYILYKKNQQLRASYRNLYQKNQEVLQLEEEYKKPQLEEKYKQSRLGETDKQALFDKVQQILSNSKEVYKPDFSLNRLAELMDSSYKKVSQVINEKAGCNFNNLVNAYRIKEACKRMNDTEQYGKYTIEAISASVGFKSRSTFLLQFKRVTGLTPSEYQRAQKSDKSLQN